MKLWARGQDGPFHVIPMVFRETGGCQVNLDLAQKTAKVYLETPT